MEFTMKKPPIKNNQQRSYKRMLALHISILVVSIVAILTRAFIAVPDGETWSSEGLFKTFLMLAVGASVSIIIELIYALSEGKAQDFAQYKRLIDPINTGLLIALLLPTATPIYALVIGVAVAVYAAKIVYGGYGYYIFNPVLVGVLFIQITFALQINVTGTPLMLLKAIFEGGSYEFKYLDLLIGNYEALAIGSTSAIVLLGLLAYLIINKVVDLRTSGAYIATIALISLIIGFVNFGANLVMLNFMVVNLITGMALFGAVFLISETITSPTSRETKIIYAVIVGVLTMIVRVLGKNVEGVAFAILFGNMITPFLNRTVKLSNAKSLRNTLIFAGVFVLVAGFALGFILQGQLIEIYQGVLVLGGLN